MNSPQPPSSPPTPAETTGREPQSGTPPTSVTPATGSKGHNGNNPDATMDQRRPPAPPGMTFWYAIANLGYGMFFALNNASLSLFLQNLHASPILIGLMGSSHSVEGAIIQPIVGTASDRLRSPLGRRRPFLLGFVPISALFLLLTPLAANLPIAIRLTAVVICIILFTVSFNIAQDPYLALMPDITPPNRRGRVTGITAFVGVLGQATLVLLPLPLAVKFGLVAIVMLITTGLTCWLVREAPRTEAVPQRRPYQELVEAARGLKILQQAYRALLAIFFAGVGIGAVLPFLTIFVKKITNCTDHQAEQMFLVLMVGTLVGVLPAGWITDRIGPKRMLMAGLSLITLAAVNGLWVTSLPQIAVVLLLAGLGNAAQSAAVYPLLYRLVPREEVGFYTGLQSSFQSIAAPLTAVITGTLVKSGNYRWIFVVCGISLAIALFLLSTTHLDRAPEEIAARDREQGRA